MTVDNNLTGLEIAVIGMSCRFPGAENISEYWDNLKNGVESITFFSNDELGGTDIPQELFENPNFIKVKGYLPEIDKFDASFFGYTPREVELMDPQLRLFHESAWEALENGGYDSESYDGLIGLFAGAAHNHYWESISKISGKSEEMGEWTAYQLVDKDYLTLRISYTLNLMGPSYSIYTACSTSLVAIHLATQAILSGDCDMALAGGITLILPQIAGYIYREGMVMSSDGHCRAFDARANGTAFGDGVGVVLLKRLEDAINEKDHIYAIIKGSAINNDGIRKSSFTAPSIDGQLEVLTTAFQISHVEPESIGYIEAHGSGTPLGDPIEIEALTLAFNTSKRNFCSLGTVKTNVGHLDAAAGVAGFIKTVLSIYHGQLPPSLHFEQSNREIDFENSPFYVNTMLQKWRGNRYPRRAGVSSFGIGGTNAHIILEETPTQSILATPSVERKERTYKLILLSAKNKNSLEQMTQNLAEHFKKNPQINLSDTSYTLQVGRRHFKYRRMLVCQNVQETLQILSSPDSEKIKNSTVKEDIPSVIFMFSGLGGQYINMGRELYEKEPIFRNEVNHCFEILKSHLDYNIEEILYPGCSTLNVQQSQNKKNETKLMTSTSLPEAKIDQTDIAQLVVFILEYALVRLLNQWGIEPKSMIGYSFGEYTAACTAGIYSLEDALKIVVKRGQLIKKIPPGTMLSIPLTREELQPLLSTNPELSLAIDNGPSCIIAGPPESTQNFNQQMKQKRLLCTPLSLSHALHSQMMESYLEEFRKIFSSITLNPPKIPYISNVTGDWITPQEATDPQYWVRHLRETVQFARGIKKLLKQSNTMFIEIGPGRDICTLVTRYINTEANNNRQVMNLIKPLHLKQDVSEAFLLHSRLGRMWLCGKKINWKNYYVGEERKRIPLPTYPFKKESCWLPNTTLRAAIQKLFPQSTLKVNTDVSRWYHIPSWKRSRSLTNRPWTNSKSRVWIVFQDDYHLGNRLRKKLQEKNQQVIIVKKGEKFEKSETQSNTYFLNPQIDNHYDTLFNDLSITGNIPERIVHFWSITSNSKTSLKMETITSSQNNGYYSLINIARSLGKKEVKDKIQIFVVTNNLQEVNENENISPVKALLLGPVNIIPIEYSKLECKCIDIIYPQKSEQLEKNLINRLLEEFTQAIKPDESIMALRGKIRWMKYYESIQLEKSNRTAPLLKERGVYLITGGIGGIGLAISEYLTINAKARLILVSRTPLPSREDWDHLLKEVHDENWKSDMLHKIRKIKELESQGAEILTFSADVTDLHQMEEVVTQAEHKWEKINGVVHCAGLADGQMIQRRNRNTTQEVMESKVIGTVILDKIFTESFRQLDFFLLSSSISSIVPSIGQVGYTSANAFLDAYANFKNTNNRGNGTVTISINWDRWQGVGVAQIAEKQHKKITGKELTGGIPIEKSLKALQQILTDNLSQVIVSPAEDINQLVKAVKASSLNTPSTFMQDAVKPSISETKNKRPELDSEYVAPRYITEKTLTELWSKFFGFEKIGIQDDFFDLGGDSLKALMLLPKIHKIFQIEIPIGEFFKRSTIEHLAKFITEEAKIISFSPITPVEEKEYYVVSPPQKRLYILQQMDPLNISYNNLVVVPLRGDIDHIKLEETFKKLIQRHEGLRTSFFILADEPVQRVHKEVEFQIEYYNPESSKSSFNSEFIIKEFMRPFNLSHSPLIRVCLIDSGENKWIMAVDMHHIISDGSSHEILTNEFLKLYSEKNLPQLKFQFKEYSEWKYNQENTNSMKHQEEYWKKQFIGKIPILNLPVDYPRPEFQNFEGNELSLYLSKEETIDLKRLALEERATLYMVLLAIFNIFLAKITGQEDIIVGMDVAGRNHTDLENIIGMFVNTLPLRNFPTEEKTFSEFLKEIKEKTLNALENQEYPFENLVETLNIKRNNSRNPLFDVMFSSLNFSDNTGNEAFQVQDKDQSESDFVLKVESISYSNRTSKFDLSLMGKMIGNQLLLAYEYSTKLFKRETIQTFANYYKKIIASVIENPNIPILEIEIVSDEERNRLIKNISNNTFNATAKKLNQNPAEFDF